MAFKIKSGEELSRGFLLHVSPDILKRAASGEPMSYEEYKELRINSYERKVLLPILDDNALIQLCTYALQQEGKQRLRQFELAENYLDAVLREYSYELMHRLSLKG